MKLTNKIEITNMWNEKITINPIKYEIAIKIVKLMEEESLLADKIGKLFLKLYDKGENIKENKELKELKQSYDELDKEEQELRKKYNYWYCGLDNLNNNDKEYMLNKLKIQEEI